jgi:hypothetical protein
VRIHKLSWLLLFVSGIGEKEIRIYLNNSGKIIIHPLSAFREKCMGFSMGSLLFHGFDISK